MSDVVAEVWRKYLLQLQLHPLRTKAITSGVIAGCSDVISQKIGGNKRIQFRRLLFTMLYGVAYIAPIGHNYHKLMEAFFPGKNGFQTTARKMLIDQLIYSPWNNVFFFVYYGLVIERGTWKTVTTKVRRNFIHVQVAGLKFWPIIRWINYQYMPVELRVLFGNIAGACWGVFLNLKAARSVTSKKES